MTGRNVIRRGCGRKGGVAERGVTGRREREKVKTSTVHYNVYIYNVCTFIVHLW